VIVAAAPRTHTLCFVALAVLGCLQSCEQIQHQHVKSRYSIDLVTLHPYRPCKSRKMETKKT
jgi:hypothetical protein